MEMFTRTYTGTIPQILMQIWQELGWVPCPETVPEQTTVNYGYLSPYHFARKLRELAGDEFAEVSQLYGIYYCIGKPFDVSDNRPRTVAFGLSKTISTWVRNESGDLVEVNPADTFNRLCELATV